MGKKRITSFIIFGISIIIFGIGFGHNLWSKIIEPQKTTERPIIISDIAPLKPLEEERVWFYHQKHTTELEASGCKVCHSYDTQKSRFDFRYPKNRPENDRRDLIETYHNSCIGCHRERLSKGLSTGPTACGECHKPVLYQEWIKPVVFHYGLHYQHEKATDKKCELCHHIYDEKEKKLIYKQGTESSCRDCHRQSDEGNRNSFRKVAHSDCINCHLEKKEKKQKGGPTTCEGCHLDLKLPSIQEIAEIPRPDRKQPKTTSIKVDGAGMPAVFFDHQRHEMSSLTCRTCHHETLQACKNCHTSEGSPEGGGISLESAFHEKNSSLSCEGCHERQKAQEKCSGCHLGTRTQMEGSQQSCIVCHTGPIKELPPIPPLGAPEGIMPDNVKAEITINILEREYEPAKFPHLQIIKKLTEISNEDPLARQFHRQPTTICMGCHHHSPVEPKSSPPTCGNCHKATPDFDDLGKPRLMAAYHLQCLGCHQKMNLEQNCTVCHAKKTSVKPLISEKQKKSK